jgi:glycosyl transferase family 87
MSAQDAARTAGHGDAAHQPSPTRLICLLGATLALGYLAALITAWLGGHFLLDGDGRSIANDFVNVWAAGRLALDGNPAAAYDWTLHKAAEVSAVGHDFPNYYGWHYPPPFLFVAAALATLPYLVAALVWLVVTLAAYAATLGGILGNRAGVLLALGFPAALCNVTAGQNGFLTATLIGGTLGLLERHPALAGLCLGQLSYKPQFGLLFPIVLIADRRWLTIVVAALTVGALVMASWLAFGSASWEAFVHWMPITGRVVLGEGAADWSRLQSLFGLMRAHGASEMLAWVVQTASALAVVAGIVALWRSPASYEIKAAGLAAGALLATPYIYMYDLVVLAVAVAFLLRLALRRGFSAADAGALGAAALLILIFPYVQTQVGLAAVIVVAGLVVQRAFSEINGSRAKMVAGSTQ